MAVRQSPSEDIRQGTQGRNARGIKEKRGTVVSLAALFLLGISLAVSEKNSTSS